MSNQPDKRPVAISVQNVAKNFLLPHERQKSIKKGFTQMFRKSRQRSVETQRALKDVSFEVKEGEFFGIVGRNGSGKSTLLKILAEIYQPTKGKVKTYGKLVPFIELGVGFDPDLTGRENIYLNGALLGFSKTEVDKKYDEIVEFAELEEFMDQKLKNYSSGMQVRLAFSIATRANADILLLDEILAVGDEAFQRKCYSHFAELKRKKKTVILVTHTMENVRNYCNRAMLIQDGIVKTIGSPDKVADEYYGLNLLDDTKNKEGDEEKPQISAQITSSRILHPSDTLEMEIKYKAINNKPILAKAYVELDGKTIMATNPRLLGWDNMVTKDTNEHIVTYSLPLKDFNKGEYKIIALLEDVKTEVNIAGYGYDGETIIKIENPDKSSSGGIFANQARMDLKQ